MNKALDCLGYAQLTSLSSATAISTGTFGSAAAAGIPAGTETVLLQAETQNVRYRDDGTNPTSSVGMILYVGTIYEFTIAQIAAMKVIEATASAKLNVTCYGSKTA